MRLLTITAFSLGAVLLGSATTELSAASLEGYPHRTGSNNYGDTLGETYVIDRRVSTAAAGGKHGGMVPFIYPLTPDGEMTHFHD